MADPKTKETLRIMAQYKKATKDPNEYVMFSVSEEDASVWYLILRNIEGLEDEFKGGEYLVKMIYKGVYNPPEFYFKTKNGLYDIDCKICISIGEYHKDQYRATLGMAGFANQLVSGLIGWREIGSGISIIKTSASKKKEYAKESVAENNKKYKELVDMVKRQYSAYSAKWDLSKVPEEMRKKLTA